MERLALEELKINLVELQAIIDKTSTLPLENLGKGDRLKLATINEYVVQALLSAKQLKTEK